MTAPDPVQRYLDELRAGLRAQDADRILAEAEDHLREGTAAGLAARLTKTEAQEAAISSFGSVRAVVRAHQTRRGRAAAIMTDVGMSACKLAWLFLLAFIVSYLVALVRLKLSASPAGSQVSRPSDRGAAARECTDRGAIAPSSVHRRPSPRAAADLSRR